jgi:hypothetical protein
MSTARPPMQKAPALTYTPPAAFEAEDLAMTDTVCISRMAVVQANVYGSQNEVVLDAVRQLVSGNGTLEEQSDAPARRLAPLGRHIQVYALSDKLAEIEDR